jgi:hypothetical protein
LENGKDTIHSSFKWPNATVARQVRPSSPAQAQAFGRPKPAERGQSMLSPRSGATESGTWLSGRQIDDGKNPSRPEGKETRSLSLHSSVKEENRCECDEELPGLVPQLHEKVGNTRQLVGPLAGDLKRERKHSPVV